MTLLTEPGTVPDTIDPIGIGRAIDMREATTAEQDAAWTYLQANCADAEELGRMLGVIA